MTTGLIAPFDANAWRDATPIFLIGENGAGLDAAPEPLRRLAEANNFAGETGALLVGEGGVLFGVGAGNDPFIIAAAAEKLKAGDYRLESADETTLFAWLLGGYRFDRYKKGKRASARLVAPENVLPDAAQRAFSAVSLARDLINTPAADMLPADLEAAARAVAESGGADCRVIVGEDLLAQNFPMIHAVGRASTTPPRLIDFVWGSHDAPKVTLVGKGVCFDSGGLDIKGASGMAIMKKDMGGAANALALAWMIMAAKLPVRLRVLIPAVENAIAGNAFRPGDILKSRKGITVEIGNTDAEGRLVLADAMALAGEDAPDLTVTLATLTGAARVALGPDLPPFYCDDEATVGEVLDAARAAHDPVWRMPLWPPYDAMISSPIADVNNSGEGSFAGSITAALFLKKFAPAKGVWAHFDIYAWRPKSAPGRPAGGEAQAIRALFEMLKRRFAV